MTRSMTHGEFQEYLETLQRLLRLRRRQREAIAEELRTHLENRFADLIEEGVPAKEAISISLSEFGDAAALAAEFRSIAQVQRRRLVMRLTAASLLAACVVGLLVFSTWLERNGPHQGQLHAQQSAPPKGDHGNKKPKKNTDEQLDANELTWRKLEKVVENVEFTQATLEEFFNFMHASFDLQFFVDRKTFDNEGIALDEPQVTIALRNVPVEMVLRLVLGQLDLDYSLDHGVLIISTAEVNSEPENLIVRVYAVDDLVEPLRRSKPTSRGGYFLGGGGGAAGPGSTHPEGETPSKKTNQGSRTPGNAPAASGGAGMGMAMGGLGGAPPKAVKAPPYDILTLMDVIESTCNPDTWEEYGGNGRMTEFRGALVVAQTWRQHQLIEQLLHDLRSAIQGGSKQSGIVPSRPSGSLDPFTEK